MMATDHIETPLPFTVKKEEDASNNSDSDMSVDEINDLLSLSLPLLSMHNSLIHDDSSSSEFIRLTEMVCLCFFYFIEILHTSYSSQHILCFFALALLFSSKEILNITVI